jgi:hypothetical protein
MYNFITEFRVTCSIGELTEHIKRKTVIYFLNLGQSLIINNTELHLQYNMQNERLWLNQAIQEKQSGKVATNIILTYPTFLTRAVRNNSVESDSSSLEINAAPSQSFIRAVYDHFITMQRHPESEIYCRNLAGMSLTPTMCMS